MSQNQWIEKTIEVTAGLPQQKQKKNLGKIKMKIKKTIFVLAIWLPLSVANATISPIGPFAGDYSEGFESPPFGMLSQLDVFPNGAFHGLVRQLDPFGARLNHTTAWGSALGSNYTVYPRSGSYFMGAALGALEWVFDTPPLRFGGYFTALKYVGTPESERDATAIFFDAADIEIAQLNVSAPFFYDNLGWTWNGWEFDTPIARIQIIGNQSIVDGGVIMHDDMEYTPVPEPATVALLGLGSLVLIRRKRRA